MSTTTNTGTNTGSGNNGKQTSDFLAGYNAAQGANIYANMVTNTNTTSTTQTSPQDIEGLVNSTMQSLLGRNATPQEIQIYGQELLAAEKQNFGTFNEKTTYGPTGKRADITGGQVSSGVDPQTFLQSIIKNTGEARQYYAINNYMDALQSLVNQSKGPM